MIHESGSIPSSKQKGIVKGCTKWKVFIGRGGWGKKALAKAKKGSFQARPSSFWGEGNSRGLYRADYLPH